MNAARRAEAVLLLDAEMAGVAREQLGGAEPVALDVHVLFLAACDATPAVRAQMTGGGRSVCFCQADARDAAGRVVARALGTFRRAAQASTLPG
jgi:acyl-coenzyme A thioesterase PaaI-like protein